MKKIISVLLVAMLVMSSFIFADEKKNNGPIFSGTMFTSNGQVAQNAKGFIFDKDNVMLIAEFTVDENGYYEVLLPTSKNQLNSDVFKHYNAFIITEDGKELYNEVINVVSKKNEISIITKDIEKNSSVRNVISTIPVENYDNIDVSDKNENNKMSSRGRVQHDLIDSFPVVFVKGHGCKGSSLEAELTKSAEFTISGGGASGYNSGSYSYSRNNATTITIPVQLTSYGAEVFFSTNYRFYDNVYEFSHGGQTYTIKKIEPGEWDYGSDAKIVYRRQNNVDGSSITGPNLRVDYPGSSITHENETTQSISNATSFSYLNLDFEFSLEQSNTNSISISRILMLV